MKAKPEIEVFNCRDKRLSISVPGGVFQALNALARRSGLRPAEVLREALRQYPPLLGEIRRIDTNGPGAGSTS